MDDEERQLRPLDLDELIADVHVYEVMVNTPGIYTHEDIHNQIIVVLKRIVQYLTEQAKG